MKKIYARLICVTGSILIIVLANILELYWPIGWTKSNSIILSILGFIYFDLVDEIHRVGNKEVKQDV